MVVPVFSTQATWVASTHTGGAVLRFTLPLVPRMTRRLRPFTLALTRREVLVAEPGSSTKITRPPSGEKRGSWCGLFEYIEPDSSTRGGVLVTQSLVSSATYSSTSEPCCS